MPQTDSTTRYDPGDVVSVEELAVGDRLARPLVPPSYSVSGDDPRSKHYHTDSDEPFLGRVVAMNSGFNNDIRHCLVFDGDSELFVRLSAHGKSQAWSQREEDWKVRDIGHTIEVTDEWDIEVPDLDDFGEEPAEFVAEWCEILFDNIRHGEEPGDEIDNFDGDAFQLRDYDGRRATVKYELHE